MFVVRLSIDSYAEVQNEVGVSSLA